MVKSRHEEEYSRRGVACARRICRGFVPCGRFVRRRKDAGGGLQGTPLSRAVLRGRQHAGVARGANRRALEARSRCRHEAVARRQGADEGERQAHQDDGARALAAQPRGVGRERSVLHVLPRAGRGREGSRGDPPRRRLPAARMEQGGHRDRRVAQRARLLRCGSHLPRAGPARRGAVRCAARDRHPQARRGEVRHRPGTRRSHRILRRRQPRDTRLHQLAQEALRARRRRGRLFVPPRLPDADLSVGHPLPQRPVDYVQGVEGDGNPPGVSGRLRDPARVHRAVRRRLLPDRDDGDVRLAPAHGGREVDGEDISERRTRLRTAQDWTCDGRVVRRGGRLARAVREALEEGAVPRRLHHRQAPHRVH